VGKRKIGLSIAEVRRQVEEHLADADSLNNRWELIIQQYDDIAPIEREVAFCLISSYMSRQDLARAYGMSEATLGRILKNPRVKQFIADMRRSARSVVASKHTRLLVRALDKVHDIFDMPLDEDSASIQLRAAEAILKFWDDTDRSNTMAINVLIANGGRIPVESPVVAVDGVVTAGKSLESIMQEVNELKEMGTQVLKLGVLKDKRGGSDGF
jgi:hypothetical protein